MNAKGRYRHDWDRKSEDAGYSSAKILILNLMPIKKPTEVQLLRLLGDTPLQLDVDFAHTVSRETTHTDRSYLEQNYLTS